MSFVPFPGPSSSGNQVLGKCTLPRWGSAYYHLPCPSHLVSWVRRGSAISGVPRVSSGELISGCDPSGGWMSTVQDPRKTWLATDNLIAVWQRMPSLGPSFPLPFRLWLSPASDNIILYIENHKDSTRKLLKLINEYIKVAGYKINTEIPCIPKH